MNKVVIISGPTASGKTSASIELALHLQRKHQLDVAVVNFDSLLFYKEISIGTAKPSLSERKNIEHHLIDIASINSPLNASDFIRLAQTTISDLLNQNKLVILVGGSGFYLRSLLKGMYESPEKNNSLADEKDQTIEISEVIEYLKHNDPDSLNNLHINDHYRLRRAAEYFKVTGNKISIQKKLYDNLLPYDFTENILSWDIIHFYLEIPKSTHQKIIEERTRKMFENGLQNEVLFLKEQGFTLSEKPLSSIGYKEIIAFMNGEFSSIDQCIERVIISTRQLAKSQRTFFKKMTPKITINPLTEVDKIFLYCSDWVDDKLDQ